MTLGEFKIRTTVNLSPRAVDLITAEAKRLQISFSDMVRRITDTWADTQQTQKPVEKILVLDRDKGMLRGAR